MENSKLIQLFKSFTKSEMKDFGKFIRSPYFNESPQLVEFYELLKKSHPEYPEGSVAKKKIFKKLYPAEKTYDDKKIRSRTNLMLQLAEEFLLQIEIKKDEITSGRFILSQYSQRKLEPHFNNKYKQINEDIQYSEIINNRYFLDRYLLMKAKRNFYEFTKPIGKREEYFKEFAEESEMLVDYSVMKLIKYYVVMKYDQGFLDYPFDSSFMQKVLEYAEENKYSGYPIFEIFKNLIRLEVKDFDETLFKETRQFFYKNVKQIENSDAILIITELYNIATKYFYAGNNKFVKEPFEIVSQMVNLDLYPVENGYMAERQYLDTVYTALAAKENEWAEKFVNDYRIKLNPDIRENAFNFSLSLIELIKENYTKALEGFAKVKVDDFYYYMRIKYNRLRIYFEIDEFDLIYTEIDSFSHYLSTNSLLPEDIRERAFRFLSFFKRLIKARSKKDYGEIEILKKDLENIDMELKRTMKMVIFRILRERNL
ncbi:hypothetical protein BH10BAC5_BH10BAC5_27920 [soil metagenome]